MSELRPTTPRGIVGSAWSGILGTPCYHYQLNGPDQSPQFAVTRFRADSPAADAPPACPMSDASLVWVSLAPTALGHWHARYDGREVGVSTAVAFATTVLDLRRSMQVRVRGPFDYLHYYLATSLLKRVASENEVSLQGELRGSFFIEDLVIAQLTRALVFAQMLWSTLDELALDQVALLLGAHVLQRYCGSDSAPPPGRKGLRPWQKLRAEEMLRAHLNGNLTLQQIAGACSLSVRHFSRGFRDSFGVSAHQYLVRLRIDRARMLLAGTRKPLAEIAQLCGFCDQPAFTRAFHRLERMTPAVWRKLNG